MTTAYHPQTNGLTERFNKTLADMLSIPDGATQDFLQRLLNQTEESRQLARLRTLEAQQKDRRIYDAKHRPVNYNPGDLVWIFTPVRKVGLSEKLL
ncbi:hypothetical protein AVEN_211819-1, partial [Araneus ventricosus]